MAAPHNPRNADSGHVAYARAQRFRIEIREPCPFCAVRSDVGCKHMVSA